MMHQRSHQPRWMYVPLAAQPRTFWARMGAALREIFLPIDVSRAGRDRIDPDEPYAHWAAGWERPALPHTEEGHRPTNEANTKERAR